MPLNDIPAAKSLVSTVPELPAAPKNSASPLAGGLLPPVQLKSFQLADVLPTHVSSAASAGRARVRAATINRQSTEDR